MLFPRQCTMRESRSIIALSRYFWTPQSLHERHAKDHGMQSSAATHRTMRSSNVSLCGAPPSGAKSLVCADADTLWYRRNQHSTSLGKARIPLVSTHPARQLKQHNVWSQPKMWHVVFAEPGRLPQSRARDRAMRSFTSPASSWLSPTTFAESSNRMARGSSERSLMGTTTKAVFLVSLLANDATVWHSICRSRRWYRDL